MTDRNAALKRVRNNLIRVLRRSALQPAFIERVFNQWDAILNTFPHPGDYKVYKHGNDYSVGQYSKKVQGVFDTVEEARLWAQWQYETDKEKFVGSLPERLLSSIFPIVESLTRRVQTNVIMPKNKRWAARTRVRNRVSKLLEDERERIELDEEGFRSAEDQLMMAFQYCSEAKTEERGKIYGIAEDHIVQKLYGPEQKVDTNANTNSS